MTAKKDYFDRSKITILEFQRHFIRIKNLYGQMLRLEPVPTIQKAVVLPTVPREPLNFLTIIKEFIKIFRTTDSNPDQLLPIFLSYPQCRDLFSNRKG